MTRYSKNLGGYGPLGPLATPMSVCTEDYVIADRVVFKSDQDRINRICAKNLLLISPKGPLGYSKHATRRSSPPKLLQAMPVCAE